ncbi:hypothetical protein EMPS_05644 [Entomortierella parvispora]|uniref:Uncharacterized protein n=1 Tax=Entomortierella parvispora TaxID=205924 RepID=A0A9P3LWI3_9FUNG|nr:hypothetical protein EMPS_05644 [Entomortierella parvispora]
MSPTLTLTNPKQNAVFHVNDNVLVKATVTGGKSSELYKKNPVVQLTLQKNLAHPGPSSPLGSTHIRDLVDHGFTFKVLKKYLVISVKTSFYVFASYKDQGTDETAQSGVFTLKK